jgi:hypothetical protein
MSTKKERELWVFELFRSSLSEEAMNTIVHGDVPDFRFCIGQSRIGLEVTELYHDSFSGLPASKERSSFGSRFTEEIIRSLSDYVSFTFGIGIVFNSNYSISSSKRAGIISCLVSNCVPAMRILQNKQSIELDFNFDIPREIQYVRILRYDGLPESFDFRPEGGTIPVLEKSHLEEVIQKKEQLIVRSSEFDELWLLIREGEYFSGSFTIPEYGAEFKSEFDRVYLLTTHEKLNLIRIC